MIAVIDYNAGNIRSVLYALERIGVEHVLTKDHDVIRAADKVIFPGVGAAESTMKHLNETGLTELIRSLKQPVFGICVGMQLLCSHSEEGDVPCIGVFPERVKRFRPTNGDKVPHMGWNMVTCPIYTQVLSHRCLCRNMNIQSLSTKSSMHEKAVKRI